ncbi:hypothetical protein K2173_017514 [Erythroxylum novogranatense]|uniref:IBH1-like N-terminal domain-containing protein n=1 Tax=Erythroxylum novogranatense TaxID=1862640 RepID=A0AAV8TKS0_9ROSI|nr:hypothetical protein K2173_017514 [Erythroxylum novogranatense]
MNRTVLPLPMASSTLTSNQLTSTSDDPSRRKKNKKSLSLNPLSKHIQTHDTRVKWRTLAQQKNYSNKLMQALSQVHLSPSSPSVPRHGHVVRQAADRALAVSAKGSTRWSRAILTNRIKSRFRRQQRKTRVVPHVPATRSKKPRLSVLRLRGKSLPAVHWKVRTLGRLVPGCRRQLLPVILEEATDYIAALEMQVRAMSALTELLSGSSSGAGQLIF